MSIPKKILVIRLKQIGDALLSLPVVNSLRATYPNAQIDYLVYQHIAPILDGQPSIDNLVVITAKERENKYLYFKKACALRKQQYDLVIDLINVPVTALLTAYCGAEHSVGFDKKRWRSKLYKAGVAHRDRGDTVTKKLDILEGLKHQAVIKRDWQIPISDVDRVRVKADLESQGINFSRRVIFIAASSRRVDKLWPEQYMVEALNHLRDKHDAQILFNWVPGMEGELVANLVTKINNRNSVFSNLDLKLKDLPVAISMCDLFFGNDGGPNHMAIGTGVPSLAIFAPLHFKESWLPLDSSRHQGIDITDALNLDHSQILKRLEDIKSNLGDYYLKLTPNLVLTKLDEMMLEFAS